MGLVRFGCFVVVDGCVCLLGIKPTRVGTKEDGLTTTRFCYHNVFYIYTVMIYHTAPALSFVLFFFVLFWARSWAEYVRESTHDGDASSIDVT